VYFVVNFVGGLLGLVDMVCGVVVVIFVVIGLVFVDV